MLPLILSHSEKSAEVKMSIPEQDDSFLELSSVLLLHLAKSAHILVESAENAQASMVESMTESMTLSNMLNTVAVLHCDPVQQEAVADYLAQSSPSVVEGFVKILHFCYTYNFSSGNYNP
jgi:hypothetical protein